MAEFSVLPNNINKLAYTAFLYLWVPTRDVQQHEEHVQEHEQEEIELFLDSIIFSDMFII